MLTCPWETRRRRERAATIRMMRWSVPQCTWTPQGEATCWNANASPPDWEVHSAGFPCVAQATPRKWICAAAKCPDVTIYKGGAGSGTVDAEAYATYLGVEWNIK